MAFSGHYQLLSVRLSWLQSTVPVGPCVALPEPRQDVVADGAGAATDLVDGQRVPDKRREGAAPDLRLRRLRDVGKDEVHGNAADEGAEAAGDQRGARRRPNGVLGIGAARGAG